MPRARKRTPPPESRFIGAGALCVGVVSIPFFACYALGWWWSVAFLIPLLCYVLHKVYGLLLLAAAWWRWRRSPVAGILVLSDSPNWKEYIEREWVPRLGERVIALDWSARKSWSRSLPVRLFKYFLISGDNFNFNPAVILLRGLRHPYVYRYYYAFHDAKHGRPEILQQLEAHMFSEFHVEDGGPSA